MSDALDILLVLISRLLVSLNKEACEYNNRSTNRFEDGPSTVPNVMMRFHRTRHNMLIRRMDRNIVRIYSFERKKKSKYETNPTNHKVLSKIMSKYGAKDEERRGRNTGQ